MAKGHLSLQPQGAVQKKFILKCPLELVTCRLNFRLMTNREAGKYAMVIIPTLPKIKSVEDQGMMAMQATNP